MSAVATLKKLVKVTGPINTFYISLKGAAYTQLKILHREKVVHKHKYDDRNRLVFIPNTKTEELLTNKIVVEVDIEEEYKAKAACIALSEGRISSPCIGEPNEPQAAVFLIRIAARLEYRRKYRKDLTKFIRAYKEKWRAKRKSLPDPKAPSTLGWRVWHWDTKKKRLFSPSWGTEWESAELRVPEWNTKLVVRGKAGIHAARMPYDWRGADLEGTELNGYTGVMAGKVAITGIVERFGKYVLGTEGWRAEWVIIRQLKAPSTEIGLEIEQAYGPDVEVYYD